MREYNDALDALCFTEEEQAMLTKKLEQAAQSAQRPRKRRHPRRVVCIAAAAAMLTASLTPALAANVPAVYETIYAFSPAIAQRLKPVNQSCEVDGVRMEVVSAAIQDNVAEIYLTIQDVRGGRFGAEAPDLDDSWTLRCPIGQSYHCELVQYDPQSLTATYYLSITNREGESFPSQLYTFSLSRLRLEQQNSWVPLDVDLSNIPLDPPLERHTVFAIGASNGFPSVYDRTDRSCTFIQPQQPLWQSKDGLFSLSAGYYDGQLHLQYTTKGWSEDNSCGLLLTGPDGITVRSDYSAVYVDDETDTEYREYVYTMPYGDWMDCTITGSLITGVRILKGNWEVSFQLNNDG